MDKFQLKLKEFVQYYNSNPGQVFLSESYLRDEKWYKELLVLVLGNILKKQNIKNGKFIELIIELIDGTLNYENLIGIKNFSFYSQKAWHGKKVSTAPRESFYNLLGASFSFAILGNFKSALKNGNRKRIIELFDILLYSSKHSIKERINIFQVGFKKLYAREFATRRLGRAPQPPQMPLNLMSILLTCAHPNLFYFFKSKEYKTTANVLGLKFDKKGDAGNKYDGVLRFAEEVKKRLQKEIRGYKIDNIDTQSFIYVSGRNKKRKITIKRDVLRGFIDDVEGVDLNEIEKEQDRQGKKPLEKIRKEAMEFITPYTTQKLGLYNVRQESVAQKERVRRLENYKCQVCGFTIEYIDTRGEKRRYVQVDHIINKADGGGEEMFNLWALCPNCHIKKTFNVIKIDVVKRIVTENGSLITIRDNHLWKK